MSCGCCSSENRCHPVVVIGVVPIVIAVAAIVGVVKLVVGLGHVVSLSPTVWVPGVLLAAGLTVWGLWLGFTVHRRVGPLKAGLFGLLVTTVGFLLYAPFIVLGVLIVLAAAVWSATAYAAGRATG